MRPSVLIRHSLLGVAAALALAGDLHAQVKPNVIVYLADDMGIGDTSAYLNKKLEESSSPVPLTLRTPNLDRFAQMGTVFTSAYSPSSMCSTSRYALLTGRDAFRSTVKSGVVTNEYGGPLMIDSQRETLGTMFQRAGYSTSLIGKWHVGLRMMGTNGQPYLGPVSSPTFSDFNSIAWPTAENPNVDTVVDGPNEHGFDYFYGIAANNMTQFRGDLNALIENHRIQGVPVWPATGTPTVAAPDWESSKLGERFINKALGVIDDYAGSQTADAKPMFMYYASQANHVNYDPPDAIDIQGTSYAVKGRSRRTNGGVGGVRDDMVYENDLAFGAMLDKLQSTIDPRTGQPMIDNTIIVFTSDNGADHPFSVLSPGMSDYKGSIKEGGSRVPFLASWAGHIPQNGVSDQTIGLVDLYSTFASVAGVTLGPNEAEDSEMMLPALVGLNTNQFQRPASLITHDNPTANNGLPNGADIAVRDGRMKLIVSLALVNSPAQSAATAGQSIPLALYDLSVDLHEDHNLVNDPAYATVVETLRQRALQYVNQGFSRSTIQQPFGPMVATDGGTSLSNSLSGAVGFEFTVGNQSIILDQLGMWDDGAADVANQESLYLNPDGDTAGSPDGLAVGHWVRLFDKSSGQQLAAVEISDLNSTLNGEFRYVSLDQTVTLQAGAQYALTMSTTAADGDLFHSPTPTTGTSAIPASSLTGFAARRAAADGEYPGLLPNGTLATGAVTESNTLYRFYLGPTFSIAGAAPVITNPSPADFNADGFVDGADLLVWQQGLGSTDATRAQGDADGNGIVDTTDLDVWKAARQNVAAALEHSAVDFDGNDVVDGADLLIIQRNLGKSGASAAEGDADGNGVVNAADLAQWRHVSSGGALSLNNPADFDGSGFVDGADLLVLQRNMGRTGALRIHGDADGNGVVNGNDVATWRRGALAGSLASTVAANPVPEVVSAPLGLLGLLAIRRTTIASRHGGRRVRRGSVT